MGKTPSKPNATHCSKCKVEIVEGVNWKPYCYSQCLSCVINRTVAVPNHCSDCGVEVKEGENWRYWCGKRCIDCAKAKRKNQKPTKPSQSTCMDCGIELNSDTWHKRSGKRCIDCFNANNRGSKDKDKLLEYHHMWWDKKTPEFRLWYNAKCRAKKQKTLFTITVNDIEIPEVCPVLGILFDLRTRKDGYPTPGSPSLDKVIPELGYTPGNVAVISHRANILKRDATMKEIEGLYKFMVQFLDKTA